MTSPHLDGGIAAWEAAGFPVERVPVMSVEELYHARARRTAPRVLDVRSMREWDAGHLADASHIEGGNLASVTLPFAQDEPLAIQCGHADRSTVATSILERRGFRNLRLLYGGFSAWEGAGYPVVRDE